MIARLEGRIEEKTENSVVIMTASGVGFEAFVPTNVLSNSKKGDSVCLHTYLQMREDGAFLFGFLNGEELTTFKLLLTVSGIGPKGALGILSGISVNDLQFAVLAEDTKTISKIPGIGAKTASKLILELKDKFKLKDTFEAKLLQNQPTQNPSAAELKEEAVQALTALGYSSTEAMKVLRDAKITEDTTVEDLIKLGLKRI